MASKKYLRRPFEYATNGSYAAGGNPWSGQPRIYKPTDVELAAGSTPNTPVPPEVANYLEQVKGDMLAVQNAEAVSRWSHTDVGGTTNVIGKFLLAFYPQLAGAPQVDTQQFIGAMGVKTSNSHAWLAVSVDGRDFTDPLNAAAQGFDLGFVGYSAISTDPFGVAFGGLLGVATCKSVTPGGTVTTFTPGNTTQVDAAHFGAGHYIIAATSIYYASALAGPWTTVAFGSAGDTVQEIADNGDLAAGVVPTVLVATQTKSFNGHHVAFYSTDDGASWTSGHDFGAAILSLTWSPAWGLFVIIDTTNAGFWTSPDGAAWTKQKTIGRSGFAGGTQKLAACGQCVAHVINRTTVDGVQAQGIAYTLDLGANWQEVYFGKILTAQPIRRLITANGRFVACDDYNLYVSGLLESPPALYQGS